MQDAGKIRHVGLSNVSPEEIVRAREVDRVSVRTSNIEDRKWEKVWSIARRRAWLHAVVSIGGGRFET
jgi:aryl-alcohol dehydrogenase-like predicted oxidoreductase